MSGEGIAPVHNEQFRQKQAHSQQARAYVDHLGVAIQKAKKMHDEMEELARKIQEGEEAKLRFAALLSNGRTPAITGPSYATPPLQPYGSQTAMELQSPTTSRIEEVPNYSLHLQPPPISNQTESYTSWSSYAQASKVSVPPQHQQHTLNISHQHRQQAQQRSAPSQQQHRSTTQRPQGGTNHRPPLNFAPLQPQSRRHQNVHQGQSNSFSMPPAQNQSQQWTVANQQAISNQPQQTQPQPQLQFQSQFHQQSQQWQQHLPPRPQTLHQPSQSQATYIDNQYYKPRTMNNPPLDTTTNAQATKITSSLAGALGQTNATMPSTKAIDAGHTQQGSTNSVYYRGHQNKAHLDSSVFGRPSSAVANTVVGLTSTTTNAANSGSTTSNSGATTSNSGATTSKSSTTIAHTVTGAESASTAAFGESILLWAKVAPAPSYYDIPGSSLRIFKNKNSAIFIFKPDGRGGLTPILIDQAHMSRSLRQLFEGENSNSQSISVSEPLTQEQVQTYRPYSVPMQVDKLASPGLPVTSSNQHTIAIPSKTPSTSVSQQTSRTPSEADKKHLARDILRALGKTPRLEDDHELLAARELEAKKRSTDQGVVKVGEVTPVGIVVNMANSDKVPPTAPLPPLEKQFSSINSTVTRIQVPAIVSPSTVSGAAGTSKDQYLSLEDLPPPPSSTPPVIEPGKKTPLFLPSPSPPSIGTGALEVTRDQNMADDDMPMECVDVATTAGHTEKSPLNSGKFQAKKTQPFYILVPPLPDYVKRYKEIAAKQANRHIREGTNDTERTEQTERTASSSADFEYLSGHNKFVRDDVEEEAVQISCSRLCERPCKWNGCDFVLNTADKLVYHISEHAQESMSNKTFLCLWQQCGRSFPTKKNLLEHVPSHALTPLFCAYQDCDESFRTPRQLVRHNQVEHSNDELKPSSEPYIPAVSPPSDPPKELPAYMVEARQIIQPEILPERHAKLGPWVLRNIAGPVNLPTKRYNAALPLRSDRRSGAYDVGKPEYHKYDFLTSSSTHFSSLPSQPSKHRDFDTLDSGDISQLVNDGLVLWHVPNHESKPKDDAPTDSNLVNGRNDDLFGNSIEADIQHEDVQALTQTKKMVAGLARNENSDEEAIQNMLTES